MDRVLAGRYVCCTAAGARHVVGRPRGRNQQAPRIPLPLLLPLLRFRLGAGVDRPLRQRSAMHPDGTSVDRANTLRLMASPELPNPWPEVFGLMWEAYEAGTIPVGAFVVDGAGDVVSRGRNRMFDVAVQDQFAATRLAHAEMNALVRLPS